MKKIDRALEIIGRALVYILPFSLFLYSSQFLFPAVTIKIFGFYIVAGICAIITGLALVRRVGNEVVFNRLHLALLAFLGATTIASLLGIDPFQSFFGTAERGIGLLTLWSFYLYAISIRIFLKRESAAKFLQIQMFIAAGMAILALLQRFFGSLQGDGFFLLSDGSRPGGTLGNPTYLAGYFVPLLFLAGMILASQIKKARAKMIACALAGGLILSGFLAANTRGAMIGVMAGLAYLTGSHLVSRLKEGRMSRKTLFIIITSVLLFAGTFVATRSSSFWKAIPLFDRLARISLADLSTVNRLTSWQVAIRGFAQHPLLGVGYENYEFLADRDYNPTQLRGGMGETYFDKPHNALLEIAATTGIVGLVAYGWLIWMIWNCAGTLADLRTRRIARAALIGYVVQNLFLFDTFGTILVFFMGIGLLLMYAAKESDASPTSTQSRLPWFALPVYIAFGVGVIAYSVLSIKGASDHFSMYLNFKLDEADTAYEAYLRAESNPAYPFKVKLMRDALESVAEQSQLLPVPTVIRILDPLFAKADALVTHYPDNYPLRITLSQTKIIVSRFNKKYLEGVETQVQRAIAISPLRQQNYYALANLYLLNGRAEDARGAIQKAIDLDSQAGDPYFQAGLIEYRLSGKENALPFFVKAAERGYRGEGKEEALMLGDFLGDAEYYDLSYESYRYAGRFIDNDPELLAKMGLVSYYGDHRERAKMHFEALLRVGAEEIKNSPNYPVFQGIFSDLGISELY